MTSIFKRKINEVKRDLKRKVQGKIEEANLDAELRRRQEMLEKKTEEAGFTSNEAVWGNKDFKVCRKTLFENLERNINFEWTNKLVNGLDNDRFVIPQSMELVENEDWCRGLYDSVFSSYSNDFYEIISDNDDWKSLQFLTAEKFYDFIQNTIIEEQGIMIVREGERFVALSSQLFYKLGRPSNISALIDHIISPQDERYGDIYPSDPVKMFVKVIDFVFDELSNATGGSEEVNIIREQALAGDRVIAPSNKDVQDFLTANVSFIADRIQVAYEEIELQHKSIESISESIFRDTTLIQSIYGGSLQNDFMDRFFDEVLRNDPEFSGMIDNILLESTEGLLDIKFEDEGYDYDLSDVVSNLSKGGRNITFDRL